MDYPAEIIMRDVFHRVPSEFAKLRALRLRTLPIIETPYAPELSLICACAPSLSLISALRVYFVELCCFNGKVRLKT